ncbi:MAG: DEAD/DEAH box helicase family protein [Burkholderiales bacterium]|nr:DEAD/DEAH box helicase family protein [Burkholderiales bacterium]
MSLTPGSDELTALRAENARLVGLLEAHGIQWRPEAATAATTVIAPSRLSLDEKVALFGRLFQGRSDVYPVRWEGKTSGKSGYSPACANEWRPGVCEKPRIKCGDCGNRELIPLSDGVLFKHLAGDHTIGAYPLLADDSCNFLAVDFDDADWRQDALAFGQSCRELGVPVALEISRSGSGAHAWIFFERRVPARDARRLGTAIISHTCARTRQLKLTSYDRLFPNQDTMPTGGFGNLIALPLQKAARERGCSVFVDDQLQPYPDQWAYLAEVPRMPVVDLESTILRATGGEHPLDVTFVEDEDLREPWKRSTSSHSLLVGPMPASLTVTLSNLVYVEKDGLPQALANRLIRLAAFQNPEFYKAQAMRMPVWDKPRVIGCAQNFPRHIGLPRGCHEALLELLQGNGIRVDTQEERVTGTPITVQFRGMLRVDQQAAVTAMLGQDTGVLCAPTAFGKTVVAAAMIASRGVNTLILVHRTELMRQWQERLQPFLGADRDEVGVVGGGKARPTGKIDIAVMQSLSRRGEVDTLVEAYGQIIIDECHHIGAVSFDAILRTAKARYVLGLTATPIRRDGQQPIIFMQCGPIRHTVARTEGAPRDLAVIQRVYARPIVVAEDAGIQEVFRQLATDAHRTAAIAEEIMGSFSRGRKILVLTERTEHLDALSAALEGSISPLLLLHGRMSPKQRSALTAKLDGLAPDAPRVLLATGKLVGEGFDHPPLDTLVLAMPISWKGTLQQYAGRLHREHSDKSDVQIIDFVDTGHPALVRMWNKRQQGYRAMGYRMVSDAPSDQTVQLRLQA